MESFVLTERPRDRRKNRLIIFGFSLFVIIVAYVMYGSVAYGLSRLGNYDFNDESYSPAVHLKTTVVTCAENNKFKTYVVTDEIDRDRGLSVFDKIRDDESMLFVFDTPMKYSIWMKNMKFPIDIVWLDHDGRVVDIKRGVLVDTYPEVFSPKEESLYVLEFNAGIAQKLNIKIGDVCSFDFS